jgi:hypothetical protein
LCNFKQRLKKKDNDSFTMMCRLSALLIGTVIQTPTYHYGTELYCSYVQGHLRITAKPNFWATRLFIKQILHCKNNAPIRSICRVINN